MAAPSRPATTVSRRTAGSAHRSRTVAAGGVGARSSPDQAASVPAGVAGPGPGIAAAGIWSARTSSARMATPTSPNAKLTRNTVS